MHALNHAVIMRGCAGTGSLRVGAEFLAKHYPGPKTILTPTPTWANHDKLFPQGGLKIQKYRYYKPETRGLDYEVQLSHPQPYPRHPKRYPAVLADHAQPCRPLQLPVSTLFCFDCARVCCRTCQTSQSLYLLVARQQHQADHVRGWHALLCKCSVLQAA